MDVVFFVIDDVVFYVVVWQYDDGDCCFVDVVGCGVFDCYVDDVLCFVMGFFLSFVFEFFDEVCGVDLGFFFE